MAEAVDQVLRRGIVALPRNEILRSRAERDEGIALGHGARGNRTRRRIASARRHDGAGAQAPGLGHRTPELARDGRALERCRKQAQGNAAGLRDLGRPLAFRRVEEECSRPIAHVGGEASRHAEADKVLWQQQHARARHHLRLMGSQPQELRSRKARHCGYAGDGADGWKPAVQRLRFCEGAPVIVEDGRAERQPGLIQQHDAMHLSRKPDGADTGPGWSRPATKLMDRLVDGAPPILGVLLGPQFPWPRDRERGGGRCHETLRLVHHHRLDRGGAEVDPEEHLSAQPFWPSSM